MLCGALRARPPLQLQSRSLGVIHTEPASCMHSAFCRLTTMRSSTSTTMLQGFQGMPFAQQGVCQGAPGQLLQYFGQLTPSPHC